jgi:hypothetical protein
VLKINSNKYPDSRSTQSGSVAKYVNDWRNSGKHCNAKINQTGTIAAKANIPEAKRCLLLMVEHIGLNFTLVCDRVGGVHRA